MSVKVKQTWSDQKMGGKRSLAKCGVKLNVTPKKNDK